MSNQNNNTSQLTSKKQGLGCGTIIIVFLLIVVGISAFSSFLTTSSPPSALSPTPAVTAQQGSYLGYSYTVLSKDGTDRHVATFTPFLPRDDQTFIGIIKSLVKTTYMEDVQSAIPQVTKKDGINTITITNDTHTYYFVPIKEDTGEIHSIEYWKE